MSDMELGGIGIGGELEAAIALKLFEIVERLVGFC